jgi:hypothetical protein
MKRYYFILLFSFLFLSCARQGSPGGGPKDESPPKLVQAIPPNESVHFTGDHLTLLFDEFIDLKNKHAAISSPHIAMRFKVRKKELSIYFEDSLKANTTYSINFADNIADLNEGNILNGLSYAFSTGDHLDSLRIKGRVQSAMTGEKKEGILIALYKNLADSAFFGDPDFLSYSNKEGDFEIKYLSPGSYRLAAFDDQNRNLRYDPYKEEVAFLFDTLVIRQDTTVAVLRLSTEINPQPGISCKPFGPGSFLLISNRPFLPTEKILITEGKAHLRSLSADTFQLYLHSAADSLVLRFISFTKDTFPIHCLAPSSPVKAQAIKEIINNNYFIIIFNSLVINILSDFKLISEADTLAIQPMIKGDSLLFSISSDSLLKYRFLRIPDSSILFTNKYINNKALEVPIKAPVKNKSSLDLLISGDSLSELQRIVILKSTRHEIRSIVPAGQKKIHFDAIPPETYQLRIVIDKNRNGSWDACSLILKEEAESLIIYSQAISIKPDWEQELEIKL